MSILLESLEGVVEYLTDYSNLTRKQRVNGDRSLSFFVVETDRNQHAFPLVTEESIVEYNGVEYRIKNVEERTIAQSPVKSVTASHVFFDIVDEFQYAVLSDGNKTINDALSLALANTGYTFSVIDSFGTVKLEGFGNDTALALFQTVLERWQAEFDIVGTDVKIRSKIGSSPDFQFRFKHNVKTFSKTVNSNNLSTYIKGYGKPKEKPLDTPSGTGKNYDTIAGTWSTSGPNHYTQQVGATFRITFTGTGFRFRHYADNTGGRWEFTLDNDKKKTVSTWASSPVQKTVEMWRDLENTSHSILATFKGDDPKHTPSTGKNTSKGWVRYDSANVETTIETYRALVGDELFTCVAEYTSPESTKYKDRNGNVKLRHAPPVSSDTITSSATLLTELQKSIIDKPEITFELEFVELQNGGFAVSSPSLGDTVPTIYEPLGVDVDLRILEIEDYPESTKSPKVTLSNLKRTFADVQFNRAKAILDKIWDENSGKLRYNVYTEAVKKATEALNNSLTELEYPVGMGIIARDPNDSSRFTALRSAGLGITTNGGETFDNAVTPDGVTTNLLTAGQIKTNNIQIIGNDDLFYWDGNYLKAIDAVNPNKYTQLNSDGLYCAKGALTVERDDGYKLVINGKANFDLNVQGGTPQAVEDDGSVYIQGQYARTASTDYKRFDYVRFSHTGRYLNLAFYGQSGGANAYSYVEVRDNSENVLDTKFTNSGSDENIGMMIDLGVPDGSAKLFYIYIKTTATEYPCKIRLATKYITG